ncbi:hypothetical protein [Paenibacillus amylolyticus]|uniref:hypothetical protein n=1 Tax=Paenibacillus amylolyticus TaxID=1451 RepID=UPI00096DE162|nr:hypothetical protein [Paenibacillus amylolyticus]OMF45396.1 hypothetical protein BK136_09855 [Paenibacillus amylolyticus]
MVITTIRNELTLHKQAFEDICQVISDFINKKSIEAKNWVCNAAPGHGKTTALKHELKKDCTEPLLIVFNNKDNMNNFYHEVFEFYRQRGMTDVIQYVDSENIEQVLENLSNFVFLCITQQRLSDLSVGVGNHFAFLEYRKNGSSFDNKLKQRKIIIDEMPDFFNDCEFDISEHSNSVEWFDKLVESSDLEEKEIREVRSIIMQLVVDEFQNNLTTVTQALINKIKGTEKETKLINALKKLEKSSTSPDVLRRYQWFVRLLNNDKVGYLNHHGKATKILCSERIDYRLLGEVLILDGTSIYNKTIYNDEYKYIEIKNYHNYHRLKVHWRDINTSKESRRDKKKGVQQAIISDIKEIREKGEVIIPLMDKEDVNYYLQFGVISKEQEYLFRLREQAGDDLPLNIFNTIGKNILKDYESLALLNLPIMNPLHYKKMAIGLFGTETNLDFAKKGAGRWFEDVRLEQLYNEYLLSQLIQIIHRSKLRDVTSDSEINAYIYTKSKFIIKDLRNVLGLGSDNITFLPLNNDSLYGFGDKCREWAKKAKKHCDEYDIGLNSMTFTPSEIGNRSFKDWLNENWKKTERRKAIEYIFLNEGLQIVVNKKNKRKTIGIL